ncbi:MAG TPA: FKBP-type peptidyl-prolyl cis-trans isomerase [Bacteroidia bacterium]|nr:FKBP-type peptidyl-prolyl cis-trans isomerase [Bacteroidia bacterium]
MSLNSSFSNQSDSVFWDNQNQAAARHIVLLQNTDSSGCLQSFLKICAQGDSMEVLLPVKEFYKDVFHSDRAPFFSAGDSVVKWRFRVKALYTTKSYSESLSDLRKAELEQIRSCFVSVTAFNTSLDSSGFYWLQRPASIKRHTLKPGDEIQLRYEGRFLNGRYLESSPEHFVYRYGEPDQVIKGLNNVIPYLQEGENVKIILPSPLAFGEQGSSNGLVPPYTPLQYNITLIQVNTP